MTRESPRHPAEEERRRILLVDDNASVRTMVAMGLRKFGCRSFEASSGEQAVGEAARSAFDLILMDLNLPGVDGLEATRRIRALPGNHGRTPIIGMTAANHQSRRPSCLEAGMNELIDKVNLLSRLPGLLRRFLGDGEGRSRRPPAPPEAAAGDTAIRFGELALRLELIGKATMARTFGDFSTRGETDRAGLTAAWYDRRREDAAALAHRLGGGAAMFQMLGLHGLLARLESALRDPVADDDSVGTLLERLNRAWPLSLTAVRDWLE